MLFTIQRFLEERFARQGFDDPDQFAVRIANLYTRSRSGASGKVFLQSLHGVRTVFFSRNKLDRKTYEEGLLDALDGKFEKKSLDGLADIFARGVVPEQRTLRQAKRHTIGRLLAAFKRSLESRGIDSFWLSRRAGRLRAKPEKIAQSLLAVFVQGALHDRGQVLRELQSGVGFVDVSILLSAAVLHLVELKVVTGTAIGWNQLSEYMKNEGRREGWLVLIETRSTGARTTGPPTIKTKHGTVRVLTIDVNPIRPSAT